MAVSCGHPKGLPLDLPPKDESDGMDEFLVMYNGFENPYCIIWDDWLNFFLSRIKCQGLCLIVDSCYSGGFNDKPMSAGETKTAGRRMSMISSTASPGRTEWS